MEDDTRERAEETAHLRGLRDILEQRRRLYELQKTRTHPNTPPNVAIDLAATEQDIRLIEAKMRRLEISPKVFDAVGVDGLFADISQRLDQLAAAISGLAQHVDDTQAADRTQREARQHEVDTRLARQDATLETHSAILTTINTRGHTRQRIEWAILVGVVLTVGILFYVFG